MLKVNLGDLIKTVNADDITEIEELKSKDIAIIGISAKLPMADNVTQFWENLKIGIDCITDLPRERKIEADSYFKFLAKKTDGIKYKKGAYFERVDEFDCQFFNIPPKEASLMDPNQRIFLETAFHALEDAGHGGQNLKGSRTGVYLGLVSDLAYQRFIANVEPASLGISIPGNMAALIPGRVSYTLDLKGPGILIDTACSSSLVAIHLACCGLRNGDCDLAVVGSVKMSLLPLEDDNMLGIESKSYLTKPFDDDADGTVMGEGVMAVVLKPLSKAIKDQDHVYAVIKGSAVNQDGSSIGITAPNALAQADVIERAWENAGIDPETITYIEAHGTGTKLGDPIEIDGINRAFAKYTTKKKFCAVGSVKSNLGHLDSAAGMVGLIKAVLSLKYKQIPPSLNFRKPNRNIDFANSPVFVNTELNDWEPGEFPRRCGVSAFGLSGTNSHVILEEAPVLNYPVDVKNSISVLALSAKSVTALQHLLHDYFAYLTKNDQVNLGDLCFTANTGRGHYDYRLAVIAANRADLTEKLELLRKTGLQTIEEKGIYYGASKLNTHSGSSVKSGDIAEAELNGITTPVSERIRNYENNSDKALVLKEIADFYIQGAAINWDDLYRRGDYRRISLPGYPFERKRCWIEIPPIVEPQNEAISKLNVNILQFETQTGSLINEMMRQLAADIDNIKNQPGISAIDLAEFEEYGLLLLLKSFQDMKVFQNAGESYHKNRLKKEIGVIAKYERLYEALIDILARGKLLVADGQQITVTEKAGLKSTVAKLTSPDHLRNQIIIDFPDLLPYVRLLEACVQNYPLILTGKVPATSVVFPNASTELVEEIYRDDKNGAFGNELAARCIQKAVEIRLAGGRAPDKVRLLEVGAGTGGASIKVFEGIKNYQANLEYYFTDISPSLVERGREIYGVKYPFARFEKLDLDREPKRESFELGSFDIVLAANVIHATRNIRQTLKRIKRLLKTNGILVMIEGTKPQDFGTLTFGALDGWWGYEDEELRMIHSPLLDLSSWQKVFEARGFGKFQVIHNEKGFQSVLIAESDGIVELESNSTNSYAQGQSRGPKGPITSNIALTGRNTGQYSANEQLVGQVWGRILGFETISIHDDLYELGGDSIIAMQIANNIEKEYDLKVDAAQVLKYRNIETFAQYLESCNPDMLRTDNVPPLVPIGVREYYPTTAEQKRIFIADQLGNTGTSFNIPGAFIIEGTLDHQKIDQAFQKLLARHETLRTSFALINDEPVQIIHREAPFRIEYREAAETEIKPVIQEFIKPFDIKQAPLVRAKLVKLSEHKHLLLFDMHHIGSDGTSLDVFIRDLASFYQGTDLPELQIQYKDFAVWQNEFYRSETIQKQEQFWLQLFQNKVPSLNLPTDYPRPAVRSFAGDGVLFKITENTFRGLNQLALETGNTLYMLLLAAYAVLLARYSGQDDIVIGSPVAGRGHADLEPLIGMFINFIPIRTCPRGSKMFREFLPEVREMALRSYENQDYQYKDLLKHLDLEKDLSRNPVFDVVFGLKRDIPELKLGDLRFTPYEFENKVARFDIVLHAIEADTQVIFSFEYCAQLFAKKTMERLGRDFLSIIDQAIQNHSIKINEFVLESTYTTLVAAAHEEVEFKFS